MDEGGISNNWGKRSPCPTPILFAILSLYNELPVEEQKSWEKENFDYIQFKGRYIVTPIKSGLLLIDQHRAHIRILYDLYRERITNRKGVGQGLLFPQV